MEQGSRGGIRLGGRVAPVVDFDFGSSTGKGDWDLSQWVADTFNSNQNYMGVSFEMRPYIEGASPQSTWKISNSAYATILANPKVLQNGCCVDIGSTNAPDDSGLNSGIFTLYLLIDKYEGHTDATTFLLIAKNNLNAYIYGDPTRNVIT